MRSRRITSLVTVCPRYVVPPPSCSRNLSFDPYFSVNETIALVSKSAHGVPCSTRSNQVYRPDQPPFHQHLQLFPDMGRREGRQTQRQAGKNQHSP